MRIQEPEKVCARVRLLMLCSRTAGMAHAGSTFTQAIKAYEDALKLNPDDPTLASRLGRALVTTHDYLRAIEYYETAAKGGLSGRCVLPTCALSLGSGW